MFSWQFPDNSFAGLPPHTWPLCSPVWKSMVGSRQKNYSQWLKYNLQTNSQWLIFNLQPNSLWLIYNLQTKSQWLIYNIQTGSQWLTYNLTYHTDFILQFTRDTPQWDTIEFGSQGITPFFSPVIKVPFLKSIKQKLSLYIQGQQHGRAIKGVVILDI